MKPIEDIKAAVIAEYARLKTIMYCVPLENGMFAHQHSLLCISWNSFGAYNDFISVDPKGHGEEAKWRAIHQLLGLSERDAVEAETERMTTAVLEAKNGAMMARLGANKLVEALEEIRKPATIIGFGRKATGKMRAQQLEEDHVMVRTIAKDALAAHKKGAPGA